ncbi:MAG: hypothetical protein QOE63_1712, partial [Acidimicrobiaceae bacterium]
MNLPAPAAVVVRLGDAAAIAI